MNIRLFKPSVGEEELQNINEAFDRSWIGLGPKVKEFEEAWSTYISSKASLSINSSTFVRIWIISDNYIFKNI